MENNIQSKDRVLGILKNKNVKPYKPFNERTAFITGVTGQCGSYLAELLLDLGYKKVVGLRRRTSTFNTARIDHLHNHPRFIAEWGNITDTTSLWRIVQKWQPDEIYNLAAQSHVKVSFDVPEETFDATAGGALKLLSVCKELLPTARIYQASSSEMFGDNPVYPQDESVRLMPASPYACAKVFAHNICRNYRESYSMHISCGILFNNESPRRGETFVTRKISQAAAKIKLGKQEILELGNLDAKRDWGYAPNFIEAMFLMLQQETPDDYVVATGETHTVKEFLEEVFGLAGLDVEKHLRINERLFRPQEVPILLGNAKKAQEKLGWIPTVKFKELAKMMYEADFEAELGL